jgi:hypothetical protein
VTVPGRTVGPQGVESAAKLCIVRGVVRHIYIDNGTK